MGPVPSHPTTYCSEPAGYLPCETFTTLLQNRSFTDLKIITKEGPAVLAHRVVLAARFPILQRILKNLGDQDLQLRRFPWKIVNTVVNYAYTGKIEFTEENVMRLFLLATSVGNSEIVDWCIKFLKPRLDATSVEIVWRVANATRNDNLMHICIPVIASNWETIYSSPKLLTHTEIDYMEYLLTGFEFYKVSAEYKLRAISTWLDSRPSEIELQMREAHVKELLTKINLTGLPAEFSLKLILSGFDQYRGLRNYFLKVLKRQSSEDFFEDSSVFNDLLKNMIGHTDNNKPLIEANKSPVANSLLCLSKPKGLENKMILSAVGNLGLHHDLSIELPFLNDGAITVLGNSVYIIGGYSMSSNNANQVSFLTPPNDCINDELPMLEPRISPSAASDECNILVFGGCNLCGQTLSSSEILTPKKSSWRPLPNMPTARKLSSATHIPSIGFLVVGGQECSNRRSHAAELLLHIDGGSPSYWVKLSPMQHSRIHPGVAVFGGRVVVAGGRHCISVESISLTTLKNEFHRGQWTKLAGFNNLTDNVSFNSLVQYNERLLLSDESGNLLEFVSNGSNTNDSLGNFQWRPLLSIKGVECVRLLAIKY